MSLDDVSLPLVSSRSSRLILHFSRETYSRLVGLSFTRLVVFLSPDRI